MNYDEDAAKALLENLAATKMNEGIVYADDIDRVLAFGRRCAEAMREETEKKIWREVELIMKNAETYDDMVYQLTQKAQAILRVEVK